MSFLTQYMVISLRIINNVNMPFYAVVRGRKLGIYNSWDECNAQVNKFAGATFKKFKFQYEAENYMQEHGITSEDLEKLKKPLDTLKSEVATTSSVISNVNKRMRFTFPKCEDMRNHHLKEINASVKKKTKKLGKKVLENKSKKLESGQKTEENDEIHSENEIMSDFSTSSEESKNISSDFSSGDVKSKHNSDKDISLDSNDKEVLAMFGDGAYDSDNISKDLFDDDDDSFLLNAVIETESSNSKTFKKLSNKLDFKDLEKIDSIVYEAVGSKKYGEYEFAIDADGYVIVFTDGSCTNNGRENAAAGFGVYFDDNHPLNTSKPVEGRATNNCGEIQAALYALNIAKILKFEKILINTDSQFLIKCAMYWIRFWYKNQWRRKTGGVVKNADELKKLYQFVVDKTIKIKWNYTKGHSNIKGNVEADRLAREGMKIYKIIHGL